MAPYLVHLTTEEQKKRWLPDFCTGAAHAIAMTEPSGGPTSRPSRPRPSATATTGSSTAPDLHHQRLLRRPGRGRRADQPGEQARGIHALRGRGGSRGLLARAQLDKVGQDESDTAEPSSRTSGCRARTSSASSTAASST
ncbi:MAG: hypothetical protein R2734_04895 [Nocardioides sp.]